MILGAKLFSPRAFPPKMLIYADWQKKKKQTNLHKKQKQKTGSIQIFVCTKRSVSMSVTIITPVEKIEAIVKYAENCDRIPWNPLPSIKL